MYDYLENVTADVRDYSFTLSARTEQSALPSNVRSIKPHQRGRNHSHTCPEYLWTIQ